MGGGEGRGVVGGFRTWCMCLLWLLLMFFISDIWVHFITLIFPHIIFGLPVYFQHLLSIVNFGNWDQGARLFASLLFCFSVIVNENPNFFFDSHRGICQGGPLSLLFFVLVVEAFSRLMTKEKVRGFIDGFSMSLGNTKALMK